MVTEAQADQVSRSQCGPPGGEPEVQDSRCNKETKDNPAVIDTRNWAVPYLWNALGESSIKKDHNRITVLHSVFSYTAVFPLQHVLKNDVVRHREIISLPAGGACRRLELTKHDPADLSHA